MGFLLPAVWADPAFEEIRWDGGTGPEAPLPRLNVVDMAGRFLLSAGRNRTHYLLELNGESIPYADGDGNGINDLLTILPGHDPVGNPDPDFSSLNDARGVNRNGDVVGGMFPTYSGIEHPFIWRYGSKEPLWMTRIFEELLWKDSPFKPSHREGGSIDVLLDIDDQGRMLAEGWCALFTDTSVTHLVDPPTVEQQFFGLRIHRPACYPKFMNNRGEILAQVNLDNSGQMIDIGNPSPFTIHYQVLPGGTPIPGSFEGASAHPFAFNDLGWIAMQVEANPAFTILLDRNGRVLHRLEGPVIDGIPQSFHGEDMNNKGQVVGYSQAYQGAPHVGHLFLPAPDYGLPAALHKFSTIGITTPIPSLAFKLRIGDNGLIFTRERLYRPTGLVTQREETGTIVIQLRPPEGITIDTKDGIDIHRGTVSLYLQDRYVRARRPGETDSEYQAYLEERQRLRRLVAQAVLSPSMNGRVTFQDIPRIDSISGIRQPARYVAEATRIETDEIDIDDPTGQNTVVLHFGDGRRFNLVPAFESPAARILEVLPADNTVMKQALIDQLSQLAPTHYAPEENLTRDALNAAEASGFDSARLLALKRAILAERFMRDSALFARDALHLSLEAASRLLGDLFNKFFKFKRRDIAARERQLARIQATPRRINAFRPVPRFDAERYRAYIRNTDTDRLIREGRFFSRVATVIDLLRPGIEWAFVKAGMQPDQARDHAALIAQIMKHHGAYLSTRTLAGTVKGDLQKLVRKLVKDSEGLLFDDRATVAGVDFRIPTGISYTARTADLLALSRNRFVTGLDTDRAAYLRDRAALISLQLDLQAQGKEAIDVATTYLLTAKALGTAARIYDLGSVAFKQAKFAAEASRFLKHLGNGTALLKSGIFAFHTAPTRTREAVHVAHGLPPPQ